MSTATTMDSSTNPMPASRVRGRRTPPTPRVYPGLRAPQSPWAAAGDRREARQAAGRRPARERPGDEGAGRVPPRPRPAHGRRLASESSDVAEAADLTRAAAARDARGRRGFLEGLGERAPRTGVRVRGEEATAVVLPEHAVAPSGRRRVRRPSTTSASEKSWYGQRRGPRPGHSRRPGRAAVPHTSSCSFANPLSLRASRAFPARRVDRQAVRSMEYRARMSRADAPPTPGLRLETASNRRPRRLHKRPRRLLRGPAAAHQRSYLTSSSSGRREVPAEALSG